MVTGKIVVVFENDGDATAQERQYESRLTASFNRIVTTFRDVTADYIAYGKTDAANLFHLTPSVFPILYYQIDGYGITELTGWRNETEMYKFFYASLKGKAEEIGNGADPSTGNGLPFGLDPNGYAFERGCNPVDTFLKFLHIGTPLKRGLYGAGALFFGYSALKSPNQVLAAGNVGLSGAFLYLFFGKEDCPFDIPTLQNNAKMIVGGGVLSVGLLAFYQLYWKDRMLEKRLTRVVRTATGKTGTATPAKRTPARRRKKVKSVTTTKRY